MLLGMQPYLRRLFDSDRLMTTLISDAFPPPPDLTRLIARADDQYLSGGCYGDVYRCWYYGRPDVPNEVWAMHARRRLAFNSVQGCSQGLQVQAHGQ